MRPIRWCLSLLLFAACGSIDLGPAPPVTTNSPGMDTGDGAATMGEEGPAGTAMDDAADSSSSTTSDGGDGPECCWYPHPNYGDPGVPPTTYGCPGVEICCEQDPPDPDCGAASITGADVTGADDGDTEGNGCETWLYRCHGWIAGIYERVGSPTNLQFDSNSAHPDILALYDVSDPNYGVGAAQCISFDICIPEVGTTNLDALLLDTCKDECELMDDIVWPDWLDATEQYFPWTGETACVFAIDGNNGTIPNASYDTNAAGGPYTFSNNATSTPKIDCTYDLNGSTVHYVESTTAPHKDQVLYIDDECENGACEDAACENWDPAGWIQTSYNATTKTYSVRVPEWMVDSILENGGWHSLYGCDDAMWWDSTTGTGEFWSMINVASGDFLYELGFRNGDKMARARARPRRARRPGTTSTGRTPGRSGCPAWRASGSPIWRSRTNRTSRSSSRGWSAPSGPPTTS